MDIFKRGDYRAFIVIAPNDNLDDPLFAFPVFEGQKVSEAFTEYRDLYFPEDAVVDIYSSIDMDDPFRLGYVFATAEVGGDKFAISTIIPSKQLWRTVVPMWEDQWVFDHVVASTGSMPAVTKRHFDGGQVVQERVRTSFFEKLRKYTLLLVTCFLAIIAWSSHKQNHN